MTQNLATASSSSQVSLSSLFAQVSDLLQNYAEPAEQRVLRAGALLRDYPPQILRTPEANFAKTAGPSLLAWQVRRLTQYIESRIELPIRIKELADVARLSPSYFCRAFRASLNETPHCFVMRRRIARSQTLMSTTDAALSQIAIDCGFADQSHFNKVHRRLVGMAPGIWRRMAQGGP